MKNSVNRGEKVIVRREAVTDHISASQRRMDILLEIDEFGLMIENKPFNAPDQKINSMITTLTSQNVSVIHC